MALDTHVNTYIQDVEDAFKAVEGAVSDLRTKVETLKGKYASHVAAVAQAVGQTVPEIEALVPATKPVLEEAEHVVNQVTQSEGTDKKAKS
ncbi:MAG: hypothetical protein KGL39_39695 [Patescibacteria group bacterium]|nr:hypothetical protein [Patescibacteria group bacterium]